MTPPLNEIYTIFVQFRLESIPIKLLIIKQYLKLWNFWDIFLLYYTTHIVFQHLNTDQSTQCIAVMLLKMAFWTGANSSRSSHTGKSRNNLAETDHGQLGKIWVWKLNRLISCSISLFYQLSKNTSLLVYFVHFYHSC